MWMYWPAAEPREVGKWFGWVIRTNVLQSQAQEIDGYILINDIPDGLQPSIGSIYDVRITEAHDYDLVGEIV